MVDNGTVGSSRLEFEFDESLAALFRGAMLMNFYNFTPTSVDVITHRKGKI